MSEFAATRWMPEEQTIAKVRSPLYPSDEPGFDLHLYPVGGPDATSDTGWGWRLPVACMTPRSRGTVTLRRLTRCENRGSSITTSQIRRGTTEPSCVKVSRSREISQNSRNCAISWAWSLRRAGNQGRQSDRRLDRRRCRALLPPGRDLRDGYGRRAGAVTDARGRIHGLGNAFVADCSIMPVIPRANTNVPAVVVGERIAGWLLEAS